MFWLLTFSFYLRRKKEFCTSVHSLRFCFLVFNNPSYLFKKTTEKTTIFSLEQFFFIKQRKNIRCYLAKKNIYQSCARETKRQTLHLFNT